MMGRMRYLLPVFFVALLLSGCQPNGATPESTEVSEKTVSSYTNARYGISFSYPSAWIIEETTSEQGLTTTLTSPTSLKNDSNFPRMILNAVGPFGTTTPSLDILEKAITVPLSQSIEGFKVSKKTDMTVGGFPARQIETEANDDKGELIKGTITIFYGNKTAYSFMLYRTDTNPEHAEDDFKQLLASIHLK